MSGKDKAKEHWDTLRKLVNKLMKECVEDATEIFGHSAFPEVKTLADMPSNTYTSISSLAGKLFDARFEAFKHDNDAGAFED